MSEITKAPTHAATRADQGGHSRMVCFAMAKFKRRLASMPDVAEGDRREILAEADQWEAGAKSDVE